MNVPTLLAYLGGSVLALAGAAGFMWGFAKAKAAETTINLQTELIDTRGKRIVDLEAENERFDDKCTTLASKQHDLEQQNRDLRDLVTGATAVHALGTELQMLIEERVAELGRVIEIHSADLLAVWREHVNLTAERLTRIERITTDTALTLGRPIPPERGSGNPLRG